MAGSKKEKRVLWELIKREHPELSEALTQASKGDGFVGLDVYTAVTNAWLISEVSKSEGVLCRLLETQLLPLRDELGGKIRVQVEDLVEALLVSMRCKGSGLEAKPMQQAERTESWIGTSRKQSKVKSR